MWAPFISVLMLRYSNPARVCGGTVGREFDPKGDTIRV